jgi:hypothetical protein
VETERGRSATWDYVGWGLVGFGAAALLSGGYLHYEAFDRAIAADDLDPLAPDYESRFDRTYSEATDYQMYAYIAYGVAALAAFAGLDVLFSWPIAVGQAEDAGYAPVPIVPMVLSDGAGMCVQFELP